MKAVMFRELYRYSDATVAEKLNVNLEEEKVIIDRLQYLNIVKRVKSSRPDDEVNLDELLSVTDENNKMLVFNYVGVLVLNDIVLWCFPKYIKEKDVTPSKFKMIVQAIRVYENRWQKLPIAQNSKESESISIISIAIAIIRNYQQYGLYMKQQSVLEINGEGDINWERTINGTQAILINERPFYPEMITESAVWDERNYFYCLHRCIVSECFTLLKKTGLTELLEIQGDFYCDQCMQDFGSSDAILQRLVRELSIQFITSKKLILQLMQLYVSRRGKRSAKRQILLYGTNSLNVVWEEACRTVLGDCLRKKIDDIEALPEHKRKHYPERNKTLLDILEKPEWIAYGRISGIYKDTLIPDVINIVQSSDGTINFYIYDAKYYNIVVAPERVSGQPGIESITKQYLYDMAYKPFRQYFEINAVSNVFVFPVDGDSRRLGCVRFPMLRNITGMDIEAIALNADVVWKLYVDGGKMDLGCEIT